MIGNSKGSNAWAIKKEKLNQSHAILANDAHMPLGLPAIWYQIHESCPSFNSIGLTIPGIPFIFTGRNNYIAWGFSNMNLDDCDFFVEKVDADTNYYFNSEGNRIRFKYVRDTIKIKNNENYTYYRKYSNRSAILKKYVNIKNLYKIIGNEKSNVYKSFHKKYNITFDWIGRRISNELDALYKLNSTKNWQQFRQALSLWGVPSVNYLYADIYGNIGLVPTGILPAREKECKPQIPNPGWITGYGWLGTKTFSNIPMLYNPPKKFVSASNNKLWRYSSDYISSYWESSSRIQRIDNLLSLYNEYNSREAQIMQLDVYSSFAKEILDLTIPIIQKSPGKLEELHRKSLRRLKKWDFQMSQQSASPIIFSQFMLKLIQNTFKDELGENLYKQFISASNLPFRRIIELVADSVSSSWFDNIRTNLYEDKDYIIQKSYTDAVDELKSMYGTDNINLWFYGVNNTIKLEHILSFYSLINPAINLQSFECGGSNTTINTMEWDMSEPYKIVSGTSMRFIADMGDNLVYTSIAGGISGDPFSDYYSNQVQLWLNGGYIALPVSNEPGSSFKQVTEFNPAKR
jgi:penicillin amidase